ncbi:unnamed protein product [Owenia fusiformis]|uniref:SMP-30/Gluconolactonase/LRE-like region domain-containing protein n=1 Tax=Owenia fusiformis TaxID=6347 RepID=A0A8S4NYI2_OWEFU|nr:unnamed protein product [Owenia fusiformis]
MGCNLLAMYFVIIAVDFGLGNGLKYGPCKSKCKKLGLAGCWRVCRIETDDVIEKSCWNKCSNSIIMGQNAEAALRGCIHQCRNCVLPSNQTDFVKIVDDQYTAEGPVFTKDGNFYMVATFRNEIVKVDLEKRNASLFVAPSINGLKGYPVGLQCDSENNIWVADATLGLLKLTQDGSFKQIATRDNYNNILQGCNDLTFDYQGNLWITAPTGPIFSTLENYTDSQEEPFGSVYCYNKTTDEIIKVTTGFLYPNGIAIQHDNNGTPKKLIFGESFNTTAPLWSYDIVSPCQVENKQVWGNLPSKSMPDGMDFDNEGDLIVTDYSSNYVYVFGPNGGAPICRLKCPFSAITNVHFRPNSTDLFITEREFHGLWKIQWKSEGMEQYCERV